MKPAAQRHLIERLLGLATRLPWWAGLLSALAVYTILHPIAILQMPAPDGMVNVAATALGQLGIILAKIGQYLMPLAFLIAAAIAGFDRWKRGELRESVAQDTTGSILRGLPWPGFRLVVADSLRRRGYEVLVPEAASQPGDMGLELTGNGRRFLVDCTDWRSCKAGAAAIRGLHERMQGIGAAGGFAVTSGQFTPEAKHFAADKNIELIDGRHLKELVRTDLQSAGRSPWLILEEIRSRFAHYRGSSAALDRGSRAEPPIGRLGSPSSPGQSPDTGIRKAQRTTDDEASAEDDEETAAGRQLTALIRSERRIEGKIVLTAPSAPRRHAAPHRPRRKWPKPRLRKIADAVGIAISLGALWLIYEQFLQLPDAPTDTPWALLGTGSGSEALTRRLKSLGRTDPAASLLKDGRPLGQYRFGPPLGYLKQTEANAQVPAWKEPVEVYRSLRELEAAFEAKYVPPPECYAYESDSLFVKCGNHRIRARRTFIDSGGKVTPTLLGSWEEPRAVVMELPLQDWQRDDAETRPEAAFGEWDRDHRWDRIPEPAEPWREEWQQVPVERPAPEPQPDWEREWAQEPEHDPDRSWQREWTPQSTQNPTQDWRRGPQSTTVDDWSRDWRSQPLPLERRHWVDDL